MPNEVARITLLVTHALEQLGVSYAIGGSFASSLHVLLILWPLLSILVLLQITKKLPTEWLQIAWTLIALIIPILGAIAFFMVAPEGQKPKA